MVSENQPDWLPPEWIEVKDKPEGKVKYYRNTETGQTFFSKEDVARYINVVNNSNSPPQPMEEDNNDLNEETKTVVVKSITIPEWLPRGWTVELRSRDSGPLIKCYVNPDRKRRFYSKPQVFRYLETVNNGPATQDGPNVVDETGEKSSTEPDASQTDEIPGWLPKGWTVKMKIRGSGQGEGRPYKCYIAPVTGRKFFSKPQVYDYLKTLNSSPAGRERVQQSVDEISGDKCSSEPDVSEDCKTVSIRRSITKPKKAGHYSPSQIRVINDTAPINDMESIEEEILPNAASETGEKSSPEFDGSQRDGIPEWLPQGWTVETKYKGSGASKGKKYKCYIAPESGRKFFSKPQVYDYLKTLNSSPAGQVQQRADQLSGEKCSSEPVVSEDCEPISIRRSITKPKKAGDNSSSLENNKVIEMGPADGLPPGWIREIRTRKSGGLLKKDPYFIDPSSGYEFRSRKDALRYLETGDIRSCVCRPQRVVVNDAAHINDTESIKEDVQVIDNAPVVELPPGWTKASVDGLPPGWIKEVRSKTTASGIRKDPYFIDPLSGYEFRSKPDALRYLKTGDIKSCAIKPKKGDSKGTKSTNEDSAPLSAADTQELSHSPIRKKLFPGGLGGPESESSKQGKDNNVSTYPIVASENHPNGTATEKHSKPGDSDSAAKGVDLFATGTQNGTRSNRSKNKNTTPPPPGRSSKRLKGAEPEIKSDPLLSERAIRSSTRGMTKQQVAEPESEANKGENTTNNLAVQEGGPGLETTDMPNGKQTEGKESELMFPLGESLGLDLELDLDPCLEFAVKTLAGEIPVEDNLVTQGVSQQPWP